MDQFQEDSHGMPASPRAERLPTLPLCGMNNLLFSHTPQHTIGVEQAHTMNLAPSSQQYQQFLRLPIPSPQLYFDNYHHPLFPEVYPAIHTQADPQRAPFAFPQPIGPLPADRYDVLGIRLHDFRYVNNHPEKLFARYMLWFFEVDDYLIRSICPSDLNDMPCEWDELQGGCPMLRLCEIKHKYPHPHVGIIPQCTPETRQNCKFIHDIEPSCRSIGKQLRLPVVEQFRSRQLCKIVDQEGDCHWGHDFERARAEAVKEYWRHKEAARAHGSVGNTKWDIWGNAITWKPVTPVES